MKKHFSFSRLLHKEKLMMLISLILAIVIWAVVDYDQGYTYEVTSPKSRAKLDALNKQPVFNATAR